METLQYIPFLYKGNMDIFNMLIKNILDEHSNYIKYIKKYFIVNIKKLFEHESYNYCIVPVDCRTNSFIEIYNRYIKAHLGKNKLYLDFITFIKQEALRIENNTIKNMNI